MKHERDMEDFAFGALALHLLVQRASKGAREGGGKLPPAHAEHCVQQMVAMTREERHGL